MKNNLLLYLAMALAVAAGFVAGRTMTQRHKPTITLQELHPATNVAYPFPGWDDYKLEKGKVYRVFVVDGAVVKVEASQ